VPIQKKPSNEINIIEYIIPTALKTQRNPKTSTIVEIKPNTGKIIIYTSG